MGRRVKLSEDKVKCRLRRAERMKLGGDMKTMGLTPNEIAALIRAYGSLQEGMRAILNRNFNRKNQKDLSKDGKV